MAIEIKQGAAPVELRIGVEIFFSCPGCGTKCSSHKEDRLSCWKCGVKVQKNADGKFIDEKRKREIQTREQIIAQFQCPKCSDPFQVARISREQTSIVCAHCGVLITKVEGQWYGVQRNIKTGQYEAPAPGQYGGNLK